MGIFYELMQKNPNKKFYSVGHRQFCPNMKKVSLSNVLSSLETLANPVELDDELMKKANQPLKRMLELAAD
jgi:quinolinate synthase